MLFDQPKGGYQGEMMPLSAATAVVKPDMRDVVIVARSRLR